MYDLSLTNDIFINNKMNAALQELDILFDTENTELIGYPNFGTNFEQFLWQLNPSESSLRAYIIEKIQFDTLFLVDFNYSIDIQIIPGELRNIYNVQIMIKDQNTEEIKTRQYQFR